MEEEKKEKKGFFARLVSGLTKTRDNIVSGIDSVFHGFSHIDDDFYEEIEEIHGTCIDTSRMHHA